MLKTLMKSGLSWLWLTVLLLGIDRYTKSWVLAHLTLYEPLEVLPFFNLTLAYNRGAAFSFLHDASGWQHIFLGGIAFIITVLLLTWLAKLPARSRWLNVSLCLILAGALGNVWDRIRFGYVIDFLDFHIGTWHFAIFNFADTVICIGAAMLFLHWCFFEKKNKARS